MGGGGKGGGGGQQIDYMAVMNETMAEMQQRMELAQQTAIREIEAKYKAQQADDVRIAEEQKLTAAKSMRDSLYSSYIGATEAAFNQADKDIATEQSNADLLGIEYKTSDDIRKDRAAGYLSSLWSGEQQSQLEQLISEYGGPADFKGFGLTRKEDTGVALPNTNKNKTVISSKVKATHPTLISSDEEDGDILGG